MFETERQVSIFIICGNICCVVAIVLVAAAMGTERWLTFTVDRSRFTSTQQSDTVNGINALFTHTRQRGMFRECYPGPDAAFLGSISNVVDKNCFMLSFSDDTPGLTENYRLAIGLHTGFMCAFVIAEIILIFIYIFGFCLCIRFIYSPIWVGAIFSFVSAFLLVVGIALFHTSWYVEQNRASGTVSSKPPLYNDWPQYVKSNTKISFKESYVTAWVAIFFTILTTIFFAFASWLTKTKTHREKHVYNRKSRREIPVVIQGGSPRANVKTPIILGDQLSRPAQPIVIPVQSQQPAPVYDNRRQPQVYTQSEFLNLYSSPQDERVVFTEQDSYKKRSKRHHKSRKHRHRYEDERDTGIESSGGLPKNELDLLRKSDKRPTSFRSLNADPELLY